jgi:uncharacterized membrane protein
MADTDHEHAEASIAVEKDLSTVYNQWTQFESFPEFMKGVEHVEQLTDTRLRWKADIGFVSREWEATIVEQVPDRIIAWRAEGDVRNDGHVSFQELAPNKTQVTVRMTYSPQGFVDKAGAKAGLVESRVRGDLEQFKEFIESRGTETGAHREAH